MWRSIWMWHRRGKSQRLFSGKRTLRNSKRYGKAVTKTFALNSLPLSVLQKGRQLQERKNAAEAAIKRLKKAMKREGQDRPFEAPPVQPKPEPTVRASQTFTEDGFMRAFNEFLYGKRPQPKRAGPVKFPTGNNAAYPRAYPRK